MRRYGFVLVAFHASALWAQSDAAIAQAVGALADYQKLAQLVPQSADYQDQIGFLLAATNRSSEAIPHFKRATELNPKFAQAWFHLGIARLITQQPSGIADLEKATSLDPANADYHFRLVTAYADIGRFADAIPHLRIAAKSLPGKSDIWRKLGDALQQQGQFKQARDAYRQALTLDPSNTALRNSYATMLVKAGNPAAGLVEFKSLVRDPDNVNVQVNVGWAYIGAGDYKEAIRYLSEVVKKHPQAGMTTTISGSHTSRVMTCSTRARNWSRP
jgi:tetratricopeptide (TPR) repeat protein